MLMALAMQDLHIFTCQNTIPGRDHMLRWPLKLGWPRSWLRKAARRCSITLDVLPFTMKISASCADRCIVSSLLTVSGVRPGAAVLQCQSSLVHAPCICCVRKSLCTLLRFKEGLQALYQVPGVGVTLFVLE